MKLYLIKGKHHSEVVLQDKTGTRSVIFDRKIHEYESNNCYQLIDREINTYGWKAGKEIFDYYFMKQYNDLAKRYL
jgi:hypothetical protein